MALLGFDSSFDLGLLCLIFFKFCCLLGQGLFQSLVEAGAVLI